jgi:glycine/D-amino acid oxidase-like deaminating enzyme
VVVVAEELSLAVAQAASGELVIRDLGEPRTRTAPLGTYPRIERAFTRCARLFPRLKGVRIVDRRHETLERGTDRRPIVGPLPVGGLYLSCGFGAGALEWLALSGSILADFLAGREPPALAAPLAFSRFETPAATTATGA